MRPEERLIIVTGTNRGIGLAVGRQLAQQGYRVLLTSRDEAKGQAAAASLRHATPHVFYHPLDVTSQESIARLRDFVGREFGRADALVNNAAVCLDDGRDVLDVEMDIFRTTIETNVFGPLLLCQAFIPLMREQKYGRVVNVSSGAGQIANMVHGKPSYRMSKIALNGLTLMLAYSVRGTNVLVNAACPGWVHTDMGGPAAPRSPEQGADGIVWLATLPDGGPSGGFFRDRKPIPW
ncbi:MAG: SDR family oxidoreductase [Anaerolineae bacterium]|nr:SDR family oxidoreductase [Anaerolineae bacterium]